MGCGFGFALLLAACATPQKRPAAVSAPAAPAIPGVKIGKPYAVFGVTYHPVDDRSYDERGIASWYGPTFHEKPTANGEIYNQDDLTAAHKTLPMPSWVEVTNLDNGRSLVVRINDRGPFVQGRIIDLSRRSAEELGVDRPGLARVRVQRVFPEGDWARDRPVAIAPAVRVATVPAAAPAEAAGARNIVAPPETVGARYIQVAALSDEGRARALASVLGDFGPAGAYSAPNGLWRVRIGPLEPERAAELVEDVRAAGYRDARVLN
ncbi:MAG: septal ring lytic transglycosylase RlpA family protein [Sandaracinobacteroides sp.]